MLKSGVFETAVGTGLPENCSVLIGRAAGGSEGGLDICEGDRAAIT